MEREKKNFLRIIILQIDGIFLRKVEALLIRLPYVNLHIHTLAPRRQHHELLTTKQGFVVPSRPDQE